ncbi:hypothetical protein SpiGrapes_3056 [Sphaerochaeta pleomorpha str. Grapes]|uniref:Uncharacterized protein n=1 Tax=Sphaerochaeta pleomorpha (strain ATCC BAA-1885 / DSM 22778 / Grapes) TaxID=158190 RepID=G8QYF7_SPHPG|nr:hypothetical protein [Sphaerochaeta pleomorpha]AEV30804.1 hypothetical protein SpiGrapes_3056 [Sphaerochaeta pleomorpha str. Grapes]
MIQVYSLCIIYLLLGSGFLLSDSYGVQFPLLLSLRYYFRNSKRFRRFLVLSGILLAVALCFFPVDPGPVFLGDLIPMVNVLGLTLWYVSQAFKVVNSTSGEDENSVLEATGQYFERNKRVFGYLTVCVACLHFLVPVSVLL